MDKGGTRAALGLCCFLVCVYFTLFFSLMDSYQLGHTRTVLAKDVVCTTEMDDACRS